jgi:hypothetical protein
MIIILSILLLTLIVLLISVFISLINKNKEIKKYKENNEKLDKENKQVKENNEKLDKEINEKKEEIKVISEAKCKIEGIIAERDKKLEKLETFFTKKNFNDEDEEYIIINDHKKETESNYSYPVKFEGSYRICVFGAKPTKGGRGGKQCAEHYFKRGSIIKFYCEGRDQGGEGGKGCGKFGGNGENGGGLSMAKYEDEFFIVGGGGGGNSEDSIKGGDFQKDGEGENGGRKGEKLQNHLKYERNSFKGGNGKGNGGWRMYCGGGGGNGYSPGDGGGYGHHGGGGGGGSCFCRADNCFVCEVNNKENSGYEIYRKISL